MSNYCLLTLQLSSGDTCISGGYSVYNHLVVTFQIKDMAVHFKSLIHIIDCE